MALTGCSDSSLTALEPDTDVADTDVVIPSDATSGELLIKFSDEMTEILDRQLQLTRSGQATRSGIPSTDEVLDILGSYSFERVFPVDSRTEARTRAAGLHLWYTVKFNADTDLSEAVRRLKQLGEVTKVQTNGRLKRSTADSRRIYVSKSMLKPVATTRSTSFPSDPGFAHQWHYNNLGEGHYDFECLNDNHATAQAGCDVNIVEAWQSCTGDPSIIVAVLDDGVMYTHPDLAANMWNNAGETQGSSVDADGNGYAGHGQRPGNTDV